MARVTQSNLPEKVGYLCGTVDGIKEDIKESKDEILREFERMRKDLVFHIDEDNRRFKEHGEELRELKTFQLKQRWVWLGICFTCSILASSAAIAVKFI